MTKRTPSTPIPWGFDLLGENYALVPASLTSDDRAWLVWGAILLGAKASCTPAPVDPDWRPGSTSWNCSVRTALGAFRVRYTMGSAYKGKLPQLEDVLVSLWSDADIARDYPNEDALMLAGLVDSHDKDDDPRETFKKARHLLRACQSARDKLERAFGPFSYHLLPEEAVGAAMDLLALHPDIDALKVGKPLGVLEIAAASCANDALCHLLATRDYSSERLMAAATLCGAGLDSGTDDENSGSILLSAIEARVLRAELPLSESARPTRKALKL